MNKRITRYYTQFNKRVYELQQLSPYEYPVNMREICDLQYVYDNDTAHLVDFYASMIGVQAPMTTMVYLHDNVFCGSKEDSKPFCMEMARRGVAVFCPNFSSVGVEPGLTRQIDDVFALLLWLYTVKEQYGTADKVVLCGNGQGALLASMCVNLLYNRRMQDRFAVQDGALQRYLQATDRVSVCGLAAVSGWVKAGTMRGGADSAAPFLEQWWGHGYARRKIVDWVDFDRNVALECVPVLLVTGEGDDTMPQSVAVDAKLHRMGVPSRLVVYPKKDDAGHTLESNWNVLFPMWQQSRAVADQLSGFCKKL